MTDQQADGARLPDGTRPEDETGQTAMHALLRAVRENAQKSASEGASAAESKDFASAALAAAQAVTILDPNRLSGGDVPEERKASYPDPAAAKPGVRDSDRDGKIGER